MSTTTKKSTTPAKKPAAKPAPAKVAAAKPEPKVSKPAEPTKPEPKTLVEALTSGATVLLKVRANGTKRSLPYYAPGSDYRATSERVAQVKASGATVDKIAGELGVSLATARRFITGLALAQDVEAGKFNAAWKPGTSEVVVHTVQAKA